MQPYHLLLSLLLTPTIILADPIPEPNYNPHADPSLLDLEARDPALLLEERQVAAGGGVIATTLAATQYPATSIAGSLFTIDGSTSATWKLMTQTFATTPLGTWDLGPTPGVGTIGLGSIEGTVGKVKTKRSLETQAAKPVLERDSAFVPGELEERMEG